MRTSSIPVVLSSLVLAGWFAPALAQDAMSVSPVVVAQPDSSPQVAGAAQLPGGLVSQPSLTNPGIVAGYTLGELYTDNLRLAGDGEPKQSSWITVLQPFVRAAYNGNRLTGSINYTLTGYHYASHSNYDQLAQDLNASGTLAIVKRHLFVQGAATYGRQIINSEAPSGSGTFFVNGNRANVATAFLSPYWVQQLGRLGTMTVGYSEGRVVYNQRGVSGRNGNALLGISNVTSYGLNFSLVSPKDLAWGWALTYQGQRLKPDNGTSLRFARAQLELSRQFGMHNRVLADFGKENRYLPDGTVKQLDATFWDVGYAWADALNTFELKGGHRFYGRSAELSWDHRATRVTTHVGYVEQPTDLNQQLMGSATSIGTTVPLGTSGIPSLLERRVYLMKRASASVDYTMSQGALTLTLYNESRDFFLRGAGHETVSNASLAWRMDLGATTTFTPTFGWQRYRHPDGSIQFLRYAQFEAVHKFGRRDFLNLRLRHASRNADAITPGGRNYTVNVVYLSWTHLFGGG